MSLSLFMAPIYPCNSRQSPPPHSPDFNNQMPKDKPHRLGFKMLPLVLLRLCSVGNRELLSHPFMLSPGSPVTGKLPVFKALQVNSN